MPGFIVGRSHIRSHPPQARLGNARLGCVRLPGARVTNLHRSDGRLVRDDGGLGAAPAAARLSPRDPRLRARSQKRSIWAAPSEPPGVQETGAGARRRARFPGPTALTQAVICVVSWESISDSRAELDLNSPAATFHLGCCRDTPPGPTGDGVGWRFP